MTFVSPKAQKRALIALYLIASGALVSAVLWRDGAFGGADPVSTFRPAARLVLTACLLVIAHELPSRLASPVAGSFVLLLSFAEARLPSADWTLAPSSGANLTWRLEEAALRGGRDAALALVVRSAQEGAESSQLRKLCRRASRLRGTRLSQAWRAYAESGQQVCAALSAGSPQQVTDKLAGLRGPAAKEAAQSLYDELGPLVFASQIGPPQKKQTRDGYAALARAAYPLHRRARGVDSGAPFATPEALDRAMWKGTLRAPAHAGIWLAGGPGALNLIVDRSRKAPVIATSGWQSNSVGMRLPCPPTGHFPRQLRLVLRSNSALAIIIRLRNPNGESRLLQWGCGQGAGDRALGDACRDVFSEETLDLAEAQVTSSQIEDVTLWGDLSLAALEWVWT